MAHFSFNRSVAIRVGLTISQPLGQMHRASFNRSVAIRVGLTSSDPLPSGRMSRFNRSVAIRVGLTIPFPFARFQTWMFQSLGRDSGRSDGASVLLRRARR